MPTTAMASSSTPCPTTAPACASRSSAGWSARWLRQIRRRADGTEVELGCPSRPRPPLRRHRRHRRHRRCTCRRPRARRGRPDHAEPGIREPPGAQPMTDRRTISIVLVDDHHMFRTGVRPAVQARRGGDLLARIVGEAGDVESAATVIKAERPDVVLLDVHLPGGEGAVAPRSSARAPAVQTAAGCRSASSLCGCPMPRRTSSPSSGPVRAATSPRPSTCRRAGRPPSAGWPTATPCSPPPGRFRARRLRHRRPASWPRSTRSSTDSRPASAR